MNWTVDGTAVATTTFQSLRLPLGSISVGGSGPSSYLQLIFPDAVGTYLFSPTAAGSATYSAIVGSMNATYYAGASGVGTLTGAGTIVVTTLTATRVAGTFTFTGISANSGTAKSITNGTFDVSL